MVASGPGRLMGFGTFDPAIGISSFFISPPREGTTSTMKRHLATAKAALAVILTFAAGSRLQAADIYVLTGGGTGTVNTTTGFGRINTSTGACTQISADVSAGNFVGNLAWNPAISAFFCHGKRQFRHKASHIDDIGRSFRAGWLGYRTIYLRNGVSPCRSDTLRLRFRE